jgi:hypothetical protein
MTQTLMGSQKTRNIGNERGADTCLFAIERTGDNDDCLGERTGPFAAA